jgi:PAS domain S-box-containing protein
LDLFLQDMSEEAPNSIAAVIQQFPVMLAALDNTGIIRVWNKACEMVTGYSDQTIVGNPQALLLLFPERNYREEIIKIWNQQQEFTDSKDQIKVKCANGEEKYISLTIRARNNPILSNLNIWGIGQDITEERQLKEELYNSEIKFKTISKTTNDVIWDRDLVNNKFWWGEGIHKTFGFLSIEVKDNLDWWVDLLHPEDKERVYSKLNEFTNGDEDFWSDEYRIKRKNGTYAIVEDKGIIIRNGEGKAIRMIGGMADQTDKKMHTQDLIIRNMQLADFAFYNSHKIRGPLVRLLSCVDLISIDENPSEDLKLLLYQIKISATEVDQMIKEAGKIIAANRIETRGSNLN